ncbi:MAG: TonB-dependent receptor [Ferruginibacter sp.]|nr:TonB-dependent receptor [Ferruginibacter sp.]
MRKLMLTLSVMLFLFITAAAQDRTITGKVTNDKNAPIEGVSITSPDGKYGTQTDKDGNYKIVVPTSVKSLNFTYINFETVNKSIIRTTTVNTSLRAEDKRLEEVVVVGYGTQQKKKVTAAIGKVGGEDIANLATSSFDKQLAGRVSGVQVVAGTGLVSSPPRIRVRGVNSLTQGRDPLIVIDGMPSFQGGASSVANTNVLADINPADIESYEVLKDGAAAAIYGSRAANGVILITIKKGKSGKLNVNYDMYMGFSNAFRVPELLNAQQFVTISNEKFTNAGSAPVAFMDANNTNTNWVDEVSAKNPFVQSHTLSASGGTDKSSFFLSLNYLSQDGIIRSNTNKRYSFRTNMELRPNKYFKFGNNITITRTEDNDQNNGGNALSGTMAGAQRLHPNVPVYNAAHPTGYSITNDNVAQGLGPNLRQIDDNYTNVAYALDKNIFNNQRTRVINNFYFELTPIKSLSFKTQASADFISAVDFRSLNKIHGDGRGSLGNVYNQSVQATILTWQNYATFNKSFRKHTITLLGGVEMQRTINQSFVSEGQNISDPFFQTNNVITNSFANQFARGFYGKRGYQSFFSRLNYDYANKYFLQFSARRDGLSSLPPDARYGNFFGGSVGYRISQEKFWTDLGFNKVFSELKLRASIAEVGNELADRFPFLSSYGLAPYGGVSGLAATRIGNGTLRWEKNKKINYGFDATFLKGRANLTFDVFENINDEQVLDVRQPVSLGIPGNIITRNIGSMQNKGVEIGLSTQVVSKKDFTWTIDLNFTSVNNKVKSLAEGQTEIPLDGPNTNTSYNILRLNNPINAYYGYRYAGVNAANGNPMWYKEDGSLIQYNVSTAATGPNAAGYYFALSKNDPNLGVATTLGNRYIVGTPLPTWFGGFTNKFSYKGFTVEAFFRFSGGNKVYNLTRQDAFTSTKFINNSSEMLNRWTTPGQVTDVPKLLYNRDAQINLANQLNDRYLEDGKFLRFQNLILAYDFDNKKIEERTKGILKSMRWYVQGQNLAIWTKYKGIDPENVSELGIDNSNVPQLRTFTFGLNLGF